MTYILQNKYYIRSPYLVENRYWMYDQNNKEEVVTFFLKPKNYELLYLTSPKLANELLTYATKNQSKKESIEKTLIKYLSRMTFRATPFGVLSTIGINHFQNVTGRSRKITRHISLDVSWLMKVVDRLLEDDSVVIKLKIKWNQMYQIHKKNIVRSEEEFDKKIAFTEEIEAIFKLVGTNEVPVIDIVEKMSSIFQTEKREIVVFIRKLISEKVVLTNLEPALPFKSYLMQILNVCPNNMIIQNLKIVQSEIENLNMSDLGEPKNIDSIKTIEKICCSIVESEHYWHVDTTNEGIGLSYEDMSTIQMCNDILTCFGIESVNKKLYRTIREFFASTYNENDEVDLLDFLYSDRAQKILNLDIPDYFADNPKVKWFYDKMYGISSHNKVLNLTDEDLQELEQMDKDDSEQLNAGYTICFQKNRNNDNIILQTDKCGLPLMTLEGRFLYLLKDGLPEHINNNEDYVFAEVSSICRVDVANNLTTSQKIEDYEISIETTINGAGTNILLEDIVVGVFKDLIYLKSKRNNKIIIPKINNALNIRYVFSKLEIFLWLIGLQYNDVKQSVFHIFNEERYVPEIRYKNLILHREQFIYVKNKNVIDFVTFQKDFMSFILENVGYKRFGLKTDSEVVAFSIDNFLHIKILYDEYKKKKRLTIVRFSEGELGSDDFHNEYICHFVNDNYTLPEVKRELIPKERWDMNLKNIAYFKIYMKKIYNKDCLIEFHDRLKRAGILPEKWYFVQYADPMDHLRIRIVFKSEIEKRERISKIREFVTETFEGCATSIEEMEYFYPEINRYGGMNKFLAIQDYFCAETSLIVAKKFSISTADIIRLVYFILRSLLQNDDNIIELYDWHTIINKDKKTFQDIFFREKNVRLTFENIWGQYSHEEYFKIFDYYLEKVRLDNVDNDIRKEIVLSITHMFFNRIDTDELPEQEWYKLIYKILMFQRHYLIE